MLAKYHRARNVSLEGLVDDPDFLSLRQHLKPEILLRLETDSGTAIVTLGVRGVTANADLALLAGEVERLEREWKLA